MTTTEVISSDQLGGTVRRTVLPNGLRVVTEDIPFSRSASCGVWVGVGSRDERPDEAGVSHFLEHLLFKGTNRRSAMDISVEIEAVGGETNAFTTKEYTCYYARVLDEHLPLALDVMCDIVTDSVMAETDVETERAVILEEIAMHDDEPADEVHDVFTEMLFGEHPLGRRISGTEETVAGLNREDIVSFYHQWYVAPRIVVAVAGNLNHERVVERVRQAFDRVERFTAPGVPQPARASTPVVPVCPSHVVAREKETEQVHLVLGGRAFSRLDGRRFALGNLNNILGAGMSSRLFQEIRERRGLAYSVYSYTSLYADTGLFAVYAGCALAKMDDVLSITRAELAKVAGQGLTDQEVTRGKGMYKGAVILGLEDSGSRMSRLGKGELVYGELLSVDELLAKAESVTPADVREVAEEVLSVPMSLAVIGPCEQHHVAMGCDS